MCPGPQSSSEDFHSQSPDTDKKQSRAAMNPPSVWPLSSLSLHSPPALYALCEKILELRMGRGRKEPCRLSNFN